MSRWTTGGALPSAVANICGSTWISPSWRFQYVHIGRSWIDLAAGRSHVDRGRELEHRPEALRPRAPGATTSCSPTSRRPRLVSTAPTVPSPASSIARTSTPVRISTPSSAHLPARPSTDSRLKAKPPWCSCRQRGHALRAPVGEDLLHVGVHLGLAGDERRAVADRLLPLEGGREVGLLDGRPERHVADRVVGVGRGVGLPDLDARLHELAHRRLEVVVAHDAAGDARGPGARLRLLQDDHVRARAGAARAKLLREVVGGGEAVDPGSDDHEAGRGGQVGHLCCLLGNSVSKLTY